MAQARRGPPRYDYTKGSIIRGITRLSVPAFGEQFTYNIETIVEVYWVGQLGSDHLAALSIAYMFLMFSRMVGFGVRVAGQALVAQQIGGGDGERASLMAGQTIVLSLAVSALITVLGLWFAPNIMGLMTSDPRLVRLGTGYLYASFALFAFVDGNFMLAHLVRGAGEPAYSLAGMTVAAAAAAILVPVFVLGIGPVPRLELTGAGLAIALARLMGAGTIAYFFLARRSRLAVRLRHFRPRWEIFRLLISLAWPISAQNVFERGGNLIMLRMLSPFGSLVLAAWGVADRVSTMARMPSFGIQEVNAIEEMSAGQSETSAGQVLRTTDREHPLSVVGPPSYERHLENSKMIAASTCWPLVKLMMEAAAAGPSRNSMRDTPKGDIPRRVSTPPKYQPSCTTAIVVGIARLLGVRLYSQRGRSCSIA